MDGKSVSRPSLCETVATLAISPDRPATVIYFCKFL